MANLEDMEWAESSQEQASVSSAPSIPPVTSTPARKQQTEEMDNDLPEEEVNAETNNTKPSDFEKLCDDPVFASGEEH